MVKALVSYTADFILACRDNTLSPSIETDLLNRGHDDVLTIEETYPTGNRVHVETSLSDVQELQKRLGKEFIAEIVPELKPI